MFTQVAGSVCPIGPIMNSNFDMTESGNKRPVTEGVILATDGPNDDAVPRSGGDVTALLEERDFLAAELSSRTTQLQQVIRDLHAAQLELAHLRGAEDRPGVSIDWSSILQSEDPETSA